MAALYQELTSEDGPLFRLLTVEASRSRDDPIECALNVLPLRVDVPPYEALSYCWGDVNDKATITCNRETVSVTKNLHAALQQLRRTDRPRVLWVDFLCINQADVTERARQVAFMRQIYELATRVVVWLGLEEEVRGKDGIYKGGDTIELCFQFCEQSANKWIRQTQDPSQKKRDKAWKEVTSDWAISSLSKSIARLGRSATWCDPDRHKYKKKHKSLRERFNGPVLPMYVFGCLLLRSWWTRAWVVQEISVAREAMVYCGSSWIEWDALSIAIVLATYGIIEDSYLWAMNEGRATSVIRFMDNLRRETAPLDLLGTLSEFRGTHATDPRDKVYAFLGLVALDGTEDEDHARAQLSVQSDYAVDVATCYRYTTLACLTGRDNLDCLSVPRIPSISSSQSALDTAASGMPSWVADWSFFAPETCEIPIGLGFAGRVDDYAACGSDIHYTARPLDDRPDLLRLSGYVLDSLNQIASTSMPLGLDRGIPYDVQFTQGKRAVFKVLAARSAEYSAVLQQWDQFVADAGGVEDKTDRRILLADLMHGGKDADDYGDESESAITRIMGIMWFKDRAVDLARLGLDHWTTATFDTMAAFVDMAERIRRLQTIGANRRLAVTAARSDLALVPQDTRPGDRVVLCEGGKLPLILRPADKGYEQDSVWELVGVAYVPNIMHGEAWNKEQCGTMLVR